MKSYKEDLQDFEDYMILKNFSKSTREAYGCGLKQFFAYHAKNNWSLPYTDVQAKKYILCRNKEGDFSIRKPIRLKLQKMNKRQNNVLFIGSNSYL